MKTRRPWLILLALTALLAGRESAAGGVDDDAARARVAVKVRELRDRMIADALQLDPTTRRTVMDLLARWEPRLREARQGAARLHRQLAAWVERGGDQTGLATLTDQAFAQHRRLRDLEERRNDELRALLTPAQQARLLVAMPRIRLEILRLILAAKLDPVAGAGEAP